MASGDQPQVDNDDEDRILSGWKPRKADVGRFTSARNGDDLMVPFECDMCVFGKLFDHEPDIVSSEKDAFAMHCIRRVILDAFWSRARSTVEANTSKVKEGLALSVSMGMRGPYENPGPLPSNDHCGYEVAVQMVASSLESGRYSNSHKQWDTIRTRSVRQEKQTQTPLCCLTRVGNFTNELDETLVVRCGSPGLLWDAEKGWDRTGDLIRQSVLI
ncbi:hypothetical protein MHU86_6288 [Fragilaria crotonensis]|nr:hypothetical protein MHU86_6288 [Fragilaria crotonensis]